MVVHAHFVNDYGVRTAVSYDTVEDTLMCEGDIVLGASFDNDADAFMGDMESLTLEDESVVFFNNDGEIISNNHHILHLNCETCNRFWEELSC